MLLEIIKACDLQVNRSFVMKNEFAKRVFTISLIILYTNADKIINRGSLTVFFSGNYLEFVSGDGGSGLFGFKLLAGNINRIGYFFSRDYIVSKSVLTRLRSGDWGDLYYHVNPRTSRVLIYQSVITQISTISGF